ncbi:MAG: SapC family protein, partial [Burkholderiales bacterium]
MDIKPPYGYQEIVPLAKQHRVALPDGRKLPSSFRKLNALPLSFTEFTVACRDYPIAFVGADTANVIAMAVLGLENQQNLFAAAADSWDATAYVPAYVRRYPFCMTRVTVDGKEQAE